MPAKVVLACAGTWRISSFYTCAVLWHIMDLYLQLVLDGRRKAGIEIF